MLPDSRPFKQHKNWLISGISFMMICRVFSCKHRERTYHNQDLIWGGYRADGISCCLIKHMTFLIDLFLCWLFNTAWQIFGKVSKKFFFFILNEGGFINTMMSNKQTKKTSQWTYCQGLKKQTFSFSVMLLTVKAFAKSGLLSLLPNVLLSMWYTLKGEESGNKEDR